jgi:hypothetical protein
LGPHIYIYIYIYICALEVACSAFFVWVGMSLSQQDELGLLTKQFGIALPRRTTAAAWVLNESTYEKCYDGLELPLGEDAGADEEEELPQRPVHVDRRST